MDIQLKMCNTEVARQLATQREGNGQLQIREGWAHRLPLWEENEISQRLHTRGRQKKSRNRTPKNKTFTEQAKKRMMKNN